MKIKAPRSGETFTPPPTKKHTEESSRPAPAPGADTLKAVQQLLQNAFQPAPQAAPPPPPRKHTLESFQPAPQAAPPPPPRKHTQASFQPAPPPKPKGPETKSAFASFASKLKEASKLNQASFQPAPPPKPKGPEPKSAFASFGSKLKEASKLNQTPFPPAPQPKLKAPKHKLAFASFASTLKAPSTLAQTKQKLRQVPKFTRLNQATQAAVLGRSGTLGNKLIAQQKLRNLARGLPDVQARAPVDRKLTQQLPTQNPAKGRQNTVKSSSPTPQNVLRASTASPTSASRSASTVAQTTPTPRTPEQKLLDDPKFTRLAPATQAFVLERSRALGNNPTAQPNLRGLATNDGFALLSPTHQQAMLEIQAQAPENRKLTSQLQNLAGKAAFRDLGDSVKSNTLTQLGRYPTDVAARRTLIQLTTAPGFARLSTTDQNRFLHYVGGTNANLSTPARQALGTLLGSNDFQRATPEQQQAQLSGFLTNQATAPGLVADIQGLGTLPRAPYTIQGPTLVENYAFRSGKTDANRYEVEVGGRRIPVYRPVAPSAANGSYGSFHTLEQVAQGLAALPASTRALVKEVRVEPAQNPTDAEVARKYNTPGFSSYLAAGGDGIIYIYPTLEPQSQYALDTGLIHETGHILSVQSWGNDDNTSAGRWGAWRTAIQNDGIRVSRYAAQTPGEDFSETLVLYQQARGTPQEAEFRAMMPERFRILDGMV